MMEKTAENLAALAANATCLSARNESLLSVVLAVVAVRGLGRDTWQCATSVEKNWRTVLAVRSANGRKPLVDFITRADDNDRASARSRLKHPRGEVRSKATLASCRVRERLASDGVVQPAGLWIR